ncbi:formyltransferase family protein [Cyclobacteriaceae bacterium]|nr:formyltransferase family protein [Cyclobacteriaceae bacterium]
MKIACITYRNWAIEIYELLENQFSGSHNFLVLKSKKEFDSQKLISFNPDLILWYGWSWMVEDLFVDKYNSIMLHPSPLPKYRGGSPIQNQIINGEKSSCVTLFKMTKNLDDGDIYKQLPFSLNGSLNQIFDRIITLGYSATAEIIDNNFELTKQDHNKVTFCKRRRPEDSEISLSELTEATGQYLHNKIRMLNDPYPNAYIKTSDNKKLYLIGSKLEK